MNEKEINIKRKRERTKEIIYEREKEMKMRKI